MKIALTGATGYVGGRLLRRLLEQGHEVRCIVRSAARFQRPDDVRCEVVEADVLDRPSLDPALEGMDAAYYLVHAMGSSDGFEEKEVAGARHFADAAERARLDRIVYLGGLADESAELSPHLRSRLLTGETLRAGTVPVTEFRASIVIGSGSLSFEMVRSLVQRLPILVTPRWVRVEAQPIAIEDLLNYLVAGLDAGEGESRVYEIGGSEVVSYGELMREYARQRGLRRFFVPVPVLSPRLSSLWLGLVTPLFARVGRKLLESVRNPSIVRRPDALSAFDIRPCGVREAIRRALENEDRAFAETRWSDALSAAGEAPEWGGRRFGSRLVDSRTRRVPVSAERAFAPVARIGGRNGWYYANWLWKLRGWIDLLVGGVGLRRGRAHPEELALGQVLDWWRVEAYEPGCELRLFAEMKLPGRAWLHFEVEPDGESASIIRQTAVFDPLGLSGLLYWYGVYPLHALIFRGMLRRIVRLAERG